MPFNPDYPQNGDDLDATPMRLQLNGLNDKIDAMSGLTSVTVDALTTLPPGEPAMVQLGITGTVLHLSFALPQGQPGPPGLQGPPFANVVIDSITTLAPGESAGVSVSFDGTLIHLSLAIPQGATGEQGVPGAPGEVTNATLASAIAGTSNNTNTVATLDTPLADPDSEALRLKINELILAQRR